MRLKTLKLVVDFSYACAMGAAVALLIFSVIAIVGGLLR